jgi:hypothetical protein
MAGLIPEKSGLAPLGVILAPMTIYFIFNGNNHIVMLLFVLLSLLNIRKEKWVWAGAFAAISCYKFLMIPPVIVLAAIIAFRKGFKKFTRFSLGGLLVVAFNAIYYVIDPSKLTRILDHKAALGAHSAHIYRFHFLFGFSKLIDGFESWYIGNDVWFYIVLGGIPISLLLYRIGRLNILQSLAVSYAIVCLFGPEGYRIEPLIGIIWLDAIHRSDYRLQLMTLVLIFIDAGVWLQYAHPTNLIFDPTMPMFLFTGRGLYLGIAVIGIMMVMLAGKNKQDLILEPYDNAQQ